jgi:hypothetical protein
MDTNAVICSNTPYHPSGVYNILRYFMMLYTIGIYWDHGSDDHDELKSTGFYHYKENQLKSTHVFSVVP